MKRRRWLLWAGIVVGVTGLLPTGAPADLSAGPGGPGIPRSPVTRAVALPPPGSGPLTCAPAGVVVPSPNSGTEVNGLVGVRCSPAGDGWAVGTSTNGGVPHALLEHWAGNQWTVVSSPDPGPGANHLSGLATLAPDDVWAVGAYSTTTAPAPQTLIEHWAGSQWAIVPSPNGSGGDNELWAVSGTASGDVWAAGDYLDPATQIYRPLFEHWDGTQWRLVAAPSPGNPTNFLNGLVAVGTNDVWAVGGYWIGGVLKPLVLHWDGQRWSHVPGPPVSADASLFWSVAATGPGDVWAVGCDITGTQTLTLSAHWDGSAWSVVPTPNGGDVNDLHAVVAQAAGDVWAAGTYRAPGGTFGLVEHWDGAAWTILPGPAVQGRSELVALAAAPDGSFWAVGQQVADPAPAQTLIERWTNPCPPPTASSTALPTSTPLRSPTPPAAMSATASPRPTTPPSTLTPTPPPLTPTPSPTEPAPTATAAPRPTAQASPPGCSASFVDVHPADYFYGPVLSLACRGVLAGYADGTFRPYASTTRAQLVKIVVLGFGRAVLTPGPGQYTFADVPPAHPFWAMVETAAAAGMIGGYACGGPGEPCDGQARPYFRPAANVTRGQLAKILTAAAGWTPRTPSGATFADVPPGSPFAGFVEAAACRQVISGYTCGGPGEPCDSGQRPYFRPGAPATRGQIAKIVYVAGLAPPTCSP